MVLNKSLQVGTVMVQTVKLSVQLIKQQEINVQNMNVELVAQMFKNYQSNVLFHLEG
jgi:DASH complex subunit DAD4